MSDKRTGKEAPAAKRTRMAPSDMETDESGAGSSTPSLAEPMTTRSGTAIGTGVNVGASGSSTPANAPARPVTVRILGSTYAMKMPSRFDADIETNRKIEELIEEITKDIPENVITEMEDQLVAFQNGVAYLGFNLVEMRKEIVYKAQEKYPQEWKSPILLALTLFMTRGTNIVRIKSHINPNFKGLVEDLVKIFNLESKAGDSTTTVTLPRMAQCFPELLGVLANKLKFTGPITDINPNFPWIMRTPSFPALIPKMATNKVTTTAIEILIDAFNMYQAKFSVQISPNQKLNQKLILKQRNFIFVSHRQSIVSNSNKEKFMTPAYGIFIGDELNPAIVDMARECRTILNNAN